MREGKPNIVEGSLEQRLSCGKGSSPFYRGIDCCVVLEIGSGADRTGNEWELDIGRPTLAGEPRTPLKRVKVHVPS